MFISGVEVDEASGIRLRRGEAGELASTLESSKPPDLFLKGLCLAAVGQFAAAEAAFLACAPSFPGPCAAQRAGIQIARHRDLEGALATLASIADDASAQPSLLGYAWHQRGLALGKLRRTVPAAAALMEALRAYREAGDRWAVSQVRDTLGTVEAARGHLEHAVHCYAMALVDKSLLGDRLGMALTLGNLGRVHLRAGRFHDAIECFTRDRELCEELGDIRGECRMHNDLGRAWLALGDWTRAERELLAGVQQAENHACADIAFYCHKDLAALRIAQRRYDEAEIELERAKSCQGWEAATYLEWIWNATLGELLVARADARAIPVLSDVVEKFHSADLPDWEIPARIALARAQLAANQGYAAEQSLLAGTRLARKHGSARYFALLNETMMELDLAVGAEEESGKSVAGSEGGATSAKSVSDKQYIRGDYLLLERLGRGGFGAVHRAYDSQRGIEVALKILDVARAYEVETREALWQSTRNELAAASRVRHPGVMRVYAVGTLPEGEPYICQEFVPGESLRQRIDRSPSAKSNEVLPLILALCHALDALHAAGVCHRDLKPDNVLLRDEQPVLIDFGIAQWRAPGWFERGDGAGTLEYMAPEQAAGKAVDPRADLYSVGVILYEWLAGRRPLQLRGETWDSRVRELLQEPPKPLSIYRPELPAPLTKLVHQLLEKRPRRRPQSARQLAERLALLIDG